MEIESAHEAANQLPTDLSTLQDNKELVSEIVKSAKEKMKEIEIILSKISSIETYMKISEKEAEKIAESCYSSYRITTSHGLASAFYERSKSLDRSMWIWVFGLIFSLAVGSLFGSRQLSELSTLVKDPASNEIAIFTNLILSILSVGAPIWFSWISTKQISQRFKLSEDYAFKASISRAYEGYRREAARIDVNLEAQLLNSALNRLDEQPLRFVDSSNFGSPIHELVSSEAVRDAIKTSPEFIGKIIEMAKTTIRREPKSPSEG